MTTAPLSNSVGAPPAGRQSWLRTLGWAAYLACSWTWCIGMFLPVLLVRDYGIWGFVVFAVPNVIGAGAMGWVLRDGVSERIVARHAIACRAFSIVTLLFQVIFLLVLLTALRPYLGMRGDLILPILWLLGLVFWNWSRSLAAIVWSLSAAVLGWLYLSGGMAGVMAPQLRPPQGVIFLAPVCAFGFALCPYLDLTFHRVREALPSGDARAAFSMGFGVLFFAMILGTLAYTPLAIEIMQGDGAGIKQAAIFGALLHLAAQLTFTSVVHIRELQDRPGSRITRELLTVSAAVLGLCILIAAVYEPRRVDALETREVIYRVFMSFYGLVFPAYVWLCMIPTGDGHSGTAGYRGRRKLIVLASATVLAAPCYWLGFIEREEIWLAPGLGIVLLARLLIRGRATDQRDVSSEAQSPRSA